MKINASGIPMNMLCFYGRRVFCVMPEVFWAFDGKGFLSEKIYL